MAPPRAARAPRHVGDLGLPELALAVPLFVLVAASGLFLFNNLLRLFAQFSSASGVKGNPVLVALQPVRARAGRHEERPRRREGNAASGARRAFERPPPPSPRAPRPCSIWRC